MALLTGRFKSSTEAQITSEELEQGGIPRSAITMTPLDDSKVEISVSTDADNAETALRIMKTHGSVDTTHHLTNWPPGATDRPADEVSKDRRFVTENRDTSREPLQDRGDVETITSALDRERGRVYERPK